jgi:hypothetical protein
MAYLLNHYWPGATESEYREQLSKVHSEDGQELPEGQLYHFAGPTEGGFLVTAVWDSKKSADQFVESTLIPSLSATGGFTTPPVEHAAETVNVVAV